MVKKIDKIIHYIADTIEDAKKIPVNSKAADMGNEVYIIEKGKTYILGSGYTWYSKDGDDKFECSCGDIMPESTIWTTIDTVNE